MTHPLQKSAGKICYLGCHSRWACVSSVMPSSHGLRVSRGAKNKQTNKTIR